MSDTNTPNVDPDFTVPTSDVDDDAQQEAPDVEVPSVEEVDLDGGTDGDDAPIDNPAG